jgi:glyoxylase-like metal-dependent hydrolase (beta-lactamase superfamily II)/rhodanese-related sulfurtransferase
MQIVTIETVELGDRSYVVHDGEVALVVDPQRDLDRVENVLAEADVRVACVAESHVHNDYVSGGLELASRHGASYVVNAEDPVAFDRVGVGDGDAFAVGELAVRVVATPGHTPTHLAYVVSHLGRVAVFSGGSLLFGAVGRTDLADAARTRELTRAQYRSARRLAELAGDAATLHPTHGFGSFCSAGSSSPPTAEQTASTIGAQRTTNPALTEDEPSFVAQLTTGLAAYPHYYAHIAPLNRAGAGPADLTLRNHLSPAALRQRLDDRRWVVDLRQRTAFAGAHLAGTVNIEHGAQFATYLGWTLPWDEPVTLLGTRGQLGGAVRDLARIGIDRPAVVIADDPATLRGVRPVVSYPVVDWVAVAEARRRRVAGALLDVRRDDEYAGGHVEGAVPVPLHDLHDRLADLPPGRLWVHCATGYRAAIAASLLHRAGHAVALVDDDWARASDALPVA